MPPDATTLTRVRGYFAGRPGVVEKRMVGGISFLVDGLMCCGVTATSLMVRAGRDRMDWALARPHVRPMTLGGRPLTAYVLVDPPGFATDTDLAAWLDLAVKP